MIWKTLPARFTGREREACRWIEECGVRGWIADLLKKTIKAQVGHEVKDFPTFIEFAEFHGWEMDKLPETQR